MFNEKVPLQGSQVRLHNYRKPGHQHSSPNTHGIHQETNTSGDERPRKQTMIYHPFSILLFSSRLCRFSLIINMKSKLTLFTVLINCVSWCKKKAFIIFHRNAVASDSATTFILWITPCTLQPLQY